MVNWRNGLGLIAMGMTTLAPAAQVLKVSASRKLLAIGGLNTASWRVNDSACIERDAANRVCGRVIKVLGKGVIFSASTANHDFQAGDSVNLRSTRRRVASDESYSQSAATEESPRGRSLRSNNLTLGADFLQPELRFEHAFGRRQHWVLGLMPVYLNFSSADGKLSGIGGFATISLYFKQAYRGFWLLTGFGGYSFTASLLGTTESATTLSALVMLGYRFVARSGWNLGLAAGGQYLTNPQTTTLQFSSILPAAVLEVGYSF